MNVLVDELENNELEFTLTDGTVISAPLIGMFNIEGQYYVVVLMESSDDKELVVLRATNVDGNDIVQLITDADEWDKVNEAWSEIVDKSLGDDNV